MFSDKVFIYGLFFLKIGHIFMNYVIFCELCDWMRFNSAKSYHLLISDGCHENSDLRP